METKSKLPKKLLSMFLAVLMAFSCFSLVMPELVPEAQAAATTTQITALVNAFKAAAEHFGEYTTSGDDPYNVTITDNSEKGYIYNVANALFDVVNGEEGSYNHNTKLRTRVKTLCANNGYTVSGDALTLLNYLIPTVGNYNTYYDGNKWSQTKTNKGSGWWQHASHTYPDMPFSNTSLSATVTRTVKQAILSDYSTVPAANTTPKTAVKMTYSATANTSTSKSCSSGFNYTCKCTRTAWYTNGTLTKSYPSTGTTPDLSAITAYLNYVAQDDDSFKSGYALYADEATRGLLISYGKDKLGTIYDNYFEKDNALTGIDSAYIAKFIGTANRTNYTDYANYCKSLVEAAAYNDHVDWIVKQTFELEGLAAEDWKDISDLQNTMAADDRAKLKSLYDLANKLYNEIADVEGMFDALKEIHSVDVKAAYEEYIEMLKDEIQKFDLRVIKNKAEFRYENEDTAEYGSEEGNLFGIKGFKKYDYDVIGAECPISDLELQAAYSWYTSQLTVILSKDSENVVAVFGDAEASYVADIISELEAEMRYREIEVEYDELYNYFEVLRADDYTVRTDEYVTKTIAEAESQLEELKSIYQEVVELYSEEEADFVFGNYISVASDFVESLYDELYKKIYDQLAYLEEVYDGGVTFSNLSLVKRAIKLIDHDLYNQVLGIGTADGHYTSEEIAELKRLYALIDVAQKEVDAKMAEAWSFSRINLEVSGTDYYTIREAMEQDMVRDVDDNDGDVDDYTVTNSKVEEVIGKLDNFVTSEDFTQLLGMYDEEAGIETLSDYISSLIQESLFNDEMINTVIAMLFPMLSDLITEQLVGMVASGLGDMGTTPTDSSAVAAIKLAALGVDVDFGIGSFYNLQGTLNLYMDGTKSTMPLTVLAERLGLNIFPRSLSNSLKATSNASKYTTITSKLTSAGTDWTKLDTDKDGALSAEDLAAAGFVWNVNDYDSFVTVIGDVFSAVLPVLQCLVSQYSFSKAVNGSDYDGGIVYAYSSNATGKVKIGWSETAKFQYIKGNVEDATLSIAPLSIYNNVWGALFEALGVDSTIASNTVTLEKPLSTTFGASGSGSTAAQMANALFMPVMSLVDTLANQPVATLTSILPNISQAMTYGLVQPLLEELSLNLTLTFDVNIQEIEMASMSGLWTALLELIDGQLPGIINGLLDPFSINFGVDLAETIDIGELLGCDITDFNSILEMLFSTAIEDLEAEGIDAIDIPSFNTGLVSRLGELKKVSSIRTENRNGSGLGSKQRYEIEADKADVFYYLIQWVIEFIAEGDNLSRLLQLLDMGTLDESITQLLSNIDAENALAALVELFVPQEPQYAMQEYNWYQPDSPASVYNFSGADFVYLKYANNWTLEKAEYVYNNLDGIINTIIEMLDPTMLEGYENGVSDMFLEMINGLFTNESMGGLVKLLIDIGEMLAGQDAINGILERDLGIDLSVWYNSFGYLFSEYYGEEEVELEAEEGEEPATELVPYGPPTPGDDTYGVYENLFPLLEVQVVETKEPQLDEEGQPKYDEETGEQLFSYSYEYKFIYDGNELADGTDGARELFTDIFTYLAQPLAPVLELLLTGEDLTLFNGAITFNGADAYDGAIIPLFEMLGIYNAPTLEEYKEMCATDVDGVDGTTIAFNYIVDLLIDFVEDFLTTETLADGTVYGPFQKLISLIPNVFYFLQSGGLSAFLKNLLHSIWVLADTVRPLVDLDIDDFLHQFLCQTLDLVYDKEEYGSSDVINLLMDLIDPDYAAPEYTEEAAAEDKETVDIIYSLTIEDLSLSAIFDLIYAMFGIDLAPVTYAVEGMAYPYSRIIDGMAMIYGAQSYGSNTGKTAWHIVSYGPDIITVLISAILDLLRYGDNAAAIDGLLGFINDNSEEGIETDITATGILEALLVVFEDKVGIEYEQPDWDYLLEGKYVQEADGNSHEWVDGDYDTLAVASDFSQYHTLNNLEYLTDWTETTAEITEAEFSGLLDFVASMLDENYDDLGAYLNDMLEDNLFTAENLKALVNAIAQLYDFIPEDILDLIDELLDIDLKSWLAYVEVVDEKHVAKADCEWWADSSAEAYVDSKEEFLGAFETLLHGVDTLVGLIFLGQDYKLFHTMADGQEDPDHGTDAIVLDGFSAYGHSLAPIFEALGYTVANGGLKPTSAYVVENADGTVTYKNSELITDVMNLLVKVVDDIAADPAKWIIDVLPGLTYFINANGLAASINNILNSVNEVIDAVNSVLDEDSRIDLSELLGGIDLSNLTMDALLKFVEDLGIYVNPALTSIVADFYMGDVVVYESASGNRAFTMTYTEAEQRHDMVTVLLAFLLEIVTDAGDIYDEAGEVIDSYDNAAAIDALIAGDGENTGIVSAIVAAVKDPDSVIYGNIDWGYMYSDEKLADRTDRVAAEGFPAVNFTYTKYATDWTEDTAAEVYAQLNDVISYLLGEFADGNTIAALLESILNDNVYTDANLKTIVELIVNALAGVDESLRNIIGAVITADIGAWFSMCDETTDEEGNTVYVLKENYFSVDTAADKKQAFIDGIMEIIIPANRLLSWFFFEDTYTFFTSTTNEPIITLQGGKGYAEGLVPILEALGLEMQPAENFWIQSLDGSEGYYNAAGAVEGILESVLGLVDKISENPSKEIFALIPNLLYFINADGLKTAVTNLVAPIDTVLRSLKDLVGGESIADLLEETIGFDLNNLSTETVLKLLVDNTGFVMNDEMLDVIERIYGLGVADEFVSANGKNAYRVDITGSEHDVLTVILSFAIDAFKLNKALFADLLPEGVYDAVITLIAGLNISDYPINWAYMYSGSMQELERSGFPATAIKYLEYSTEWTETTADSVYSVLDEILDMVLPAVIEDGDLYTLVADLIDGNLYKTENLETIVELIVNLLADFDESLRNVVDAVLDVDIAAWFAMCEKNAEGEYEVIPGTLNGDDKESFISGLKTVLEPANELLSWLFFGTSYTFFNGTTSEVLITVNGGKGYAYGILPILEALGVEGLQKEYRDADGNLSVTLAVEDILNKTLELVDNLAASESTVEFVFTLLPNLIYFINADGLKASVNNLVAPVDAIIACLSDVVGEESLAALLTDVIGIDISNLDTATLLGLLETELGFVMNDEMKYAIRDIYAVGEAEKYTSVNGKTAYRIVPDMGDTLTVILSFALDAFNLNEELFADLLGEEEYKAVYNLIRGANEQFVYAEIDWDYMYGEDGTFTTEGMNKYLPEYPENSTAATYLIYGNNWNEETAEYVVDVVDRLIESIMGETSLGQMLDNAITNGLYQDDILNSLLEAVVGLIVDYAEIIEGAGVLLGAESISKWFDYVEIDADGNAVCTHDFGIDEAATNEEKRALFVEAFVDVLEPAYRLLSWLLFDQEFTFFNGTTNDPLITLTGGRGYEEALVPLLEALGAKMPGLEDKAYENGETAIKPASAYVTTDNAGNVTAVDMEAAVRDVFSALTDWLYVICGDLQNPGEYGVITAMLDLLPNVVYNINAGTLSAVVKNLLVPVEEILGHLEAFGLEVDFTTIVEIDGQPLDITNLSWYSVFDIVASLVDLYWPAEIEDFLATLYVGKAVEFTSANGKTAYYMTFNDADEGTDGYLVSDRKDLATLIISFAIDGVLDKRNAPRLIRWFGEDIYNVIYAYLSDTTVEVPMQDIDWALLEPVNYADTGIVISPITLGAKINSEFYGELYTREMGEYIEKWLPSFVDSMIVLLGVQKENGENYTGLEDVLNELIGTSLYTKANAEALLELIQGLLPQAEEALGAELYEIVVNVLEKALEIDLTYWNNYTVADFADGDREAFVDEITRMLAPLYPILAWLLTDEDLIALFYKDTVINEDGSKDAVVIEGAEGYAYGIIPLLEAFDYDSELILTPEEFKAASTDAPSMLKNVLNPLLDVIDRVLEDPVNEIFNVLPGVIYFLNSNGLDTVIKNTANAVFTVLENIEPVTGELDIYELIGFDAENMNIESLISELIEGLEEDTGFQLTEVAMEALKELTVGTLISFDSKNGNKAYTVEYATGADRVDMVTVVLRTVLTFISIPENVVALEGMLEGSLDEEGYKFVCSLLENFSQMAASEGGMDEIMYTVYQIFYAANVAAHSTEDWLAEFNGDYSFLNELFKTSDLAFLRQIEISLGDLLNKYTGDIIDDNEIVPNGFIAFFQKIADFFKKIGEFFKNLFK